MRDIHTTYRDLEISIREKENHLSTLLISSYGARLRLMTVVTKQYEGNSRVVTQNNPNGLKYPKGQKNTSELSSIETLY